MNSPISSWRAKDHTRDKRQNGGQGQRTKNENKTEGPNKKRKQIENRVTQRTQSGRVRGDTIYLTGLKKHNNQRKGL